MSDVKVKEILGEVAKHPGVATRLAVVEIGGVEYLDIRDIISGAGEVLAGRGYLFPLNDHADRTEQLYALGETISGLAERRST